MAQETADVAIIGGGPAGLSAASSLLRQLHSVVLFDSGRYRNSDVAHMHMVPTWNHKDPSAFRSTTREELLQYYSTIRIVEAAVNTVKKESDCSFEVVDSQKAVWHVKKVILASGSEDIMPKITGYERCWKKRIFHCLFCHGYEDRGAQSSGVLAVDFCALPTMAIHLSENAQQLTKSVTVYTNGDNELSTQLQPAASAKLPYKIDARVIKEVKLGEGCIVLDFDDGSQSSETFLVHNPLTKPNGHFVSQLGLKVTEMGDIVAEAPFHQTSSRGVFAAGDCITPYKVAPGAISSGCNAGVAASTQLQAEKYGHHPMF